MGKSIFGVVLVPDIKDSQNDEVSKDEIAKALHTWLAKFKSI